jgi:probable H4MPT-linked C1 transfer pathway protein
MRTWLALDIGGANLKAADGAGFVLSLPFPLWKQPDDLPQALGQLLSSSPTARRLAVTMTGELADCFETKAEGVRRILEAVERANGRIPKRVYLTDGRLVSPQAAMDQPLLAAASNWHVLARFVGRYVPQRSGLLVDIGSTTCDVIPLVDGRPAAKGQTDPDRMVWGELVYTGVQRSPVCAVLDQAPWMGRSCPVAHELFATTWDAYLVLGALPEETDRFDTADGRPATKEAAWARLARMVCADSQMASFRDVAKIARAVADAQLESILAAAHKAVQRLPEPPARVVISGQGEFLARRVADRLVKDAEIVSLGERLGVALSRAATAHALAVIAGETCP